MTAELEHEMRADEVECEYERAIGQAITRGDNDRARDLSVGLSEYRDLYRERAS